MAPPLRYSAAAAAAAAAATATTASSSSGASSRGYNSHRNNDPMVQLSKALSYTLRHGAAKERIPMRADGYIDLTILLGHPRFRNYSEADIRTVVETNDKQRFTLRQEEDGRWWIKANQGHSIHLDNIELDTIHDANEVPVVIHGTTTAAWRLISSSGHLSRMGRQHIHMAAGLPGDNGVISGMRHSSDIHIYIDAAKAIADGIVFLRSPNNVILTEGIEGKLPLLYVSRVTTRTGQQLALPQLTKHDVQSST